MTAPAPGWRTIEVEAEVFELLHRTATSRDTDINAVLRYLLAVPQVTGAATTDEGE